jgi:hypothetical protein
VPGAAEIFPEVGRGLVGVPAPSGFSASFFALRVEARTAFFAQRSSPFKAFLMSALVQRKV